MHINVSVVPIARFLPVFSPYLFHSGYTGKKIFCLMSYPCDPTNKQIQMFYGKWSLTPTNSALVEIFVFSFCFLDLQCTIPYPKDIQPPVCVFKSGCTPYAASNHVHNWLMLSAPIILYHPWCVLGISIPTSTLPCTTWCSWSLWLTGTIWRAQFRAFPFFYP